MYSSRIRSCLLAASSSLAVALLPLGAAAQGVLHNGCDSTWKLAQQEVIHNGHMGQSIAVGDFNDDGFKDVAMGG